MDYATPSLTNLALKKPFKESDKGDSPGINDGYYSFGKPYRYSTGASNKFPKHTTIDLGKVEKINTISFMKMPASATKNIDFLVSQDGSKFTHVANVFLGQNKSNERFVMPIEDIDARYIRIQFKDHHENPFGASSKFQSMISELEVYYLEK